MNIKYIKTKSPIFVGGKNFNDRAEASRDVKLEWVSKDITGVQITHNNSVGIVPVSNLSIVVYDASEIK